MPFSSGIALGFLPGLVFLAAVPVILWLHLRRRRPRHVVVPSLTPWLALATPAPRRRRVPPTVLLALHVALATLAALAMARPSVPGGPEAAVDRVVVLDVTTSMTAGDRWPQALERAEALLGSARGEVSLVTLGPRPRVIVARGRDGRTAASALGSLVPGGTGAATDEALQLAAAVAGPGADIVVVSDGAAPPPGPGAPAARWELVGAPEDNVAVLEAAAWSAREGARLFARVASFSAHARRVPLSLSVDGRTLDTRVLALEPGGTQDLAWDLPAGSETAEVRVAPGDALPADDAALVPLAGAGEVRVQLVGASPAVERALGALPGVTVERAGMGTYRADGSVDVSVFVGDVPEPLPPGGVVVFDPAPGGPFGAGTEMRPSPADPAGAHALVTGLDLAGVVLSGLRDQPTPGWATPILNAAGRTAAYAGDLGGRRVAVLAFDPDAGDLHDRLAFPLLVARAIGWAAPTAVGATVVAGQPVDLPPGEFVVQGPAGQRWTVGGLFEDTGRPGLYVARAAELGRPRTLRFGVLAGDVVESDLMARSEPQDEPSAGPEPLAVAAGRPLWGWLVGLALVVALVEGAWRGRWIGPDRGPRGGGS